HAIMLPHTAAYNAPEAPQAMHRAARALKADNVAEGLWALAERIKAPRALKDIGMPESGIDKATELALKNPYWNPRPLTEKDIRALIRRAWAGEAPLACAFRLRFRRAFALSATDEFCRRPTEPERFGKSRAAGP